MAHRVLIAHPNREERKRLAALVRAGGLEPVEVTDGTEAIAKGRETRLALVAPRLARQDGLTVAERLRRGAGSNGPAVVLLNDVYPVDRPKERLLKEFGLADVLTSPADPAELENLIGRWKKLPRRSTHGAPKTTDLGLTPLPLLLARSRLKHETVFIYAQDEERSLFIVLAKGELAQITSNGPDDTSSERLLIDALTWTEGRAMVIHDPGIEETCTGRIDLLPFLDAATTLPLAENLDRAATRLLERSARAVFETNDDPGRREAITATLFERDLLVLADGARTTTRLRGLAELGGLPLAALIFRLEVLGLLRRRRPGGAKSSNGKRPDPIAMPELSPLATADAKDIPATGLLAAGETVRLLTRLERRRETGTLALKAGKRTVEIAFRDGRITGANSWGDGVLDEDPVKALAARNELRPEDVPILRRLHAQRQLLDIAAAERVEWTLRRGAGSQATETLAVLPGALCTELLRSSRVELAKGPTQASSDVAGLATSLGLTRTESAALEAWDRDGVEPSRWLRSLGTLLDATTPIGKPLADRHLALAAKPGETDEAPKTGEDLESLFDRALDEGLRHGDRAGAPRASAGADEDDDDLSLDLAADHGSATSFSLEQGVGGVVIRVGDRQYAIDGLLKEVSELRREKKRLRKNLAQRLDDATEREGEVDAVRMTVHELENFTLELKTALLEKEQALEHLQEARGHVDVQVAELQAVLPEKDRLLDERAETAAKLQAVAREARDSVRDRERTIADITREREGLKERSDRLDGELRKRDKVLAEAEERLALLSERADRAEKDLSLARSERDALTTRLTMAEAPRRRRGLFRSADPSTESPAQRASERVSEQKRQAAEANRVETVELKHRVIELEGLVARRDAERARLTRERERLDERLATALAEINEHKESTESHKSRWEKAERILAEKTTALQIREQDLESLQGGHHELAKHLESARATSSQQGDAIADLGEERSGLRSRIGELEAENARLAKSTASFGEERTRLEWSIDEARQTGSRATSALEAVRSAREELATRLAEAIAQKSNAEEERERFSAESRRLGGELRTEREGRAEEKATLEGKLHARLTEQNRVEDQLKVLQTELGGLRDQLPSTLAARDEALKKFEESDEIAKTRAETIERITRDLSKTEKERKQLETTASEGTATIETERESHATEKDDLIQRLDRGAEQKSRVDARLEATADELAALRARLPAVTEERDKANATVHELTGHWEKAKVETNRLSQALTVEQARVESERKNHEIETKSEREALASERIRISDLNKTLAKRESEFAGAQKEVESGVQALRRLQQETDTRFSEQSAQLERARGDLAKHAEESASEISTWKARAQRSDNRLTRVNEQEQTRTTQREHLDAQVNTARLRVAQDVRRISELATANEDLKNRLSRSDQKAREGEAQLKRLHGDVEQMTGDLAQKEKLIISSEADLKGRVKDLDNARNRLKSLSDRDRRAQDRIAALDATLTGIKANFTRVSHDKQSLEERFREELVRAKTENQALARGHADSRSAVAKLRDEARTAQVRERQVRALLAQKETEAATLAGKGATGANEIALAKKVQEAQTRLGTLEKEMSTRITAETALRHDTDQLREKLRLSVSQAQRVQAESNETARQLVSEKNALLAAEGRIHALDEGIADRDGVIEMRDLLVAERDAAVEEGEEALKAVQARAADLETRVTDLTAKVTETDRQPSPPPPTPTAAPPVIDPGPLPGAVPAPLEPATAAPAAPAAPAAADKHAESRQRLESIFAGADQLTRVPRRTAADPSDPLGLNSPALAEDDIASLERQKQALMKTSTLLNREMGRLRDEMDKKAAEVEEIERAIAGAAPSTPGRHEFVRRAKAATEELHAFQADLGIGRVRMAEVDRQLLETRRQLDQASNPGGESG